MATSRLDKGSITNGDISSSANVEASKLQTRTRHIENFDLAIGANVADKEVVAYVASASATIQSFQAKVSTAATSGTVSFDLKKNGSTILSATVDITSTETTSIQSGTISNATLTANDVLSIDMNDSSSDGKGPVCILIVDENPS